MGWFRNFLGWLLGEPPPPDASASWPREAAPSPSSTDIQAEPRRTSPAPQASASLDLGAADFLPIPRDEMLEAAASQGVAVWANPWFGRRDLIPPATDQRTLLIDKGMVAEGLLTPFELVEIHEVGAEMDHYRTDLEAIQRQAMLAGEAAVQAEKDRRAALKARKKEEAAERRRRHAEAVAHRRQARC